MPSIWFYLSKIIEIYGFAFTVVRLMIAWTSGDRPSPAARPGERAGSGIDEGHAGCQARRLHPALPWFAHADFRRRREFHARGDARKG